MTATWYLRGISEFNGRYRLGSKVPSSSDRTDPCCVAFGRIYLFSVLPRFLLLLCLSSFRFFIWTEKDDNLWSNAQWWFFPSKCSKELCLAQSRSSATILLVLVSRDNHPRQSLAVKHPPVRVVISINAPLTDHPHVLHSWDSGPFLGQFEKTDFTGFRESHEQLSHAQDPVVCWVPCTSKSFQFFPCQWRIFWAGNLHLEPLVRDSSFKVDAAWFFPVLLAKQHNKCDRDKAHRTRVFWCKDHEENCCQIATSCRPKTSHRVSLAPQE